ncbi:endolytic transglycosylase MltG [Halochromatium salexigens]|uniref:endolytic transglycosylase MltG n=1 Tax=Halochromatium salexigens TaxID=49447 RepID=UPI001911BFE3
MRAFFAAVLSLILVGVALFGVLWFEYQRFLARPIELGAAPPSQVLGETSGAARAEAQTGPRVFEIRLGTRLHELAHRLRDEGLIDDPYFFIALAYQEQLQGQIKAGEYALTTGMRPLELLRLFARGRSIQYPVTLIEGWTFREAVESLADHDKLQHALADLSESEIMQRIGIDEPHPEGWLFPDTYLVARASTDVAVLKRAHERMQQVLNEEWEQRAEGLPLETPYEALILASIIEKETGLAEERPDIAGVFVRRLQRGMRLQTDPTVIYGMGEAYDGNIRRADLRRATPYNTYVIDGLPPTPIALPGREAIHAALHPADGETLYFVSRGDGSHHFSPTLEEHNCAVRQYQLGGRCHLIEEAP